MFHLVSGRIGLHLIESKGRKDLPDGGSGRDGSRMPCAGGKNKGKRGLRVKKTKDVGGSRKRE